jgi:hypothetical protein
MVSYKEKFNGAWRAICAASDIITMLRTTIKSLTSQLSILRWRHVIMLVAARNKIASVSAELLSARSQAAFYKQLHEKTEIRLEAAEARCHSLRGTIAEGRRRESQNFHHAEAVWLGLSMISRRLTDLSVLDYDFPDWDLQDPSGRSEDSLLIECGTHMRSIATALESLVQEVDTKENMVNILAEGTQHLLGVIAETDHGQVTLAEWSSIELPENLPDEDEDLVEERLTRARLSASSSLDVVHHVYGTSPILERTDIPLSSVFGRRG